MKFPGACGAPQNHPKTTASRKEPRHDQARSRSKTRIIGADNWYILLWIIPSPDGRNWIGQRSHPAKSIPIMADGMDFACESESER